MRAISIIVILNLPSLPILNAHATELGLTLLLIICGIDFSTTDRGLITSLGVVDFVTARTLSAVDRGEAIGELAVFLIILLDVRVVGIIILDCLRLNFFLGLSCSFGAGTGGLLSDALCLGRSGLLCRGRLLDCSGLYGFLLILAVRVVTRAGRGSSGLDLLEQSLE